MDNFSLTTSATLEGSISLTANQYSDNIISISGLDNYPSKGDVFACLVEDRDGSSRSQIHFGVSDTNNYYEAALSTDNNLIRLRKRENGDFVELDQHNISVGTGIYDIEVTWKSDDTIEVRVFDFDTKSMWRGSQVGSTLSASDSTHDTETGIGFRPDGSGSISEGDIRWDWYRILDKDGN
jgi:hypothetical protein